MELDSGGWGWGHVVGCRGHDRVALCSNTVQIALGVPCLRNLYNSCVGRDSSVGIATLDGGSGIEYRWGRDFPLPPHRSWALRSLLYNGYRVSYQGVERPGRSAYHPPPSSAEVKERVELYLYSLSGTSWPILG